MTTRTVLSTRAKQTLTILAGIVVAMVMMGLGLWQMASYQESTRDVSAERAAQPAVELADEVAPDGTISDIYGRRTMASGTYLPQYQVLVGTEAPWRVATLLRMEDGRHVTVVRGTVEPGAVVPEAPEGPQDIEGIFLASDKSDPGDGEEVADLATLRLQELAQEWPSPLIAGYITLPAEESAAQGLGTAPLQLPAAEGSATHRGYALQWWVFAAGAIAFAIYIARGLGREPAPTLSPEQIDADTGASSG